MAATLGALASKLSITQANGLVLPATWRLLRQQFRPHSFGWGTRVLMAAWLRGRLRFELEAYRRTLYQPYWVHLQRNTAAVITDTTTQINNTVVALILCCS